jgi:hypothetical protein
MDSVSIHRVNGSGKCHLYCKVRGIKSRVGKLYLEYKDIKN